MISQNKIETELQMQRTNRWLPEGTAVGEERGEGNQEEHAFSYVVHEPWA